MIKWLGIGVCISPLLFFVIKLINLSTRYRLIYLSFKFKIFLFKRVY